MSNYTLDFESSLKEIEDKIDSIKATGIKAGMDVSDAVRKLEDQLLEEKKIFDEVTKYSSYRKQMKSLKNYKPFNSKQNKGFSIQYDGEYFRNC